MLQLLLMITSEFKSSAKTDETLVRMNAGVSDVRVPTTALFFYGVLGRVTPKTFILPQTHLKVVRLIFPSDRQGDSFLETDF
jgi:hypothetical protein